MFYVHICNTNCMYSVNWPQNDSKCAENSMGTNSGYDLQRFPDLNSTVALRGARGIIIQNFSHMRHPIQKKNARYLPVLRYVVILCQLCARAIEPTILQFDRH